MRQSAIPKLSKLKTAQRAELLKLWTATLGSPPRIPGQPRAAVQRNAKRTRIRPPQADKGTWRTAGSNPLRSTNESLRTAGPACVVSRDKFAVSNRRA